VQQSGLSSGCTTAAWVVFKLRLPMRLQRTDLSLFGATTKSQEKQSFGTGKCRQHRRGAFTPPARDQSRRPRAEGWASRIGSRRSRPMGSASDWPVCKAEPKGQDSCPPRGENAADGPISRASQRPDPRRAYARTATPTSDFLTSHHWRTHFDFYLTHCGLRHSPKMA